MNKEHIKSLINEQKINHTLDQSFYINETIFKLDLENFFFKQWIFIGHISRIPNVGDFFLFNIDNESIIIIRDKNDVIHAHFNVCRHRGSRICLKDEGNKKLLVCPYHAWSYKIDGTLKSARLMKENFIESEWSLHRCNVKVYEGLIFINFSKEPISFDEFIEPNMPYIELHGLKDAKIAYRKVYPTYGNWKLTLDNFHECYHCQPSHPEYCLVHDPEYIQAYGGGSGTGPSSEKFSKRLAEWNEKTKKLGYLTGEYSERNSSNFSRGAERTPLSEGKLSETKSGKPACKKLMGKFKEHDHGYTGIGPSPFNSLLMCNDFATLFTFVPKSPLQTDVELMWLVHKDAEEGKDYNLEDIIWMWDKTTIADKRIIENNQKGVLSSKYQPGPLSTMELGVEDFKNWYLKILSLALEAN